MIQGLYVDLGDVEADREEEDGDEVLEEALLDLSRVVHRHVVVDRVVHRDIPANSLDSSWGTFGIVSTEWGVLSVARF